MSKCKLQKGEISILIEEQLLDSSGNSWIDDWTVNCDLEVGTVLRIPYEPQNIKEIQSAKPPVVERNKQSENKPAEETIRDKKDFKPGRVTKPKKQTEIPKNKPIITNVAEDSVEKEEIPVPVEEKKETTIGDENMAKKDQELIATVEQPGTDNLSAELMQMAKDNASDPTVTIILAAMAVFGGGAAMKFYKQWAEQRHEEKMAKIKADSKSQNDSPGQCQAVHAQLTAELADVKGRVGSLENKVSLNADFDGDRLERRVKKLEKWRKDSEEE